MKTILILLAFSLAPIWRAAPDKRGMDFWTYERYVGSEEYINSHIPYEDAVAKAREAYFG